jgi:hypothetical protein
MGSTISKINLVVLTAALFIASCAPQASPTPTPDMIGTMAMEIAFVIQTQTAEAILPPPLPPTASATANFTETPSGPPTETPAPRSPAVVVFAGCYTGPGESYTLISNIDPSIRPSGRQIVTILGMGSEPGWVVIRNPYFNNPCWIKSEFLDIDPLIDLTQYPVMTPSAR